MSKRTEAQAQRPASQDIAGLSQIARATGPSADELRWHLEAARRELRQGHLDQADQELAQVATVIGKLSGATEAEGLALVRGSLEVVNGRILQRRGDVGAHTCFEVAARYFEEAPSKASEAWACRDYGVALYEVGRLDEARQALGQARECGDQSYETVLYLGVLALRDGNPATAEPLLREAAEKEPLAPEAMLNLAMALELSGQSGADAEAGELFLRAGRQLWELARSEEALEAFRAAVRLRPEDPDARLALGEAYRLLGKYREAVEVVQQDTEFYYALGTKGAALLDLDRPEEALEALERAVELEPTYAFGLGFRGEVLRQLGRPEEALESLDRALAEEPSNFLWLGIRGEVLRLLGRYDEALEVLDQAIALNSDLAFAHGSRGAVLSQIDKPAEALEALDHAVALDPMNVLTHARRGDVLCRLGRLEEALEELDRAVELDPMDAFAHAHRGEALRRLDRPQEALKALDLAVELDPMDAFAHARRGDILRGQSRLEEALVELDQAIELEPANAWSQVRRADVLRLQGRDEEALEAVERTLALEPSTEDRVYAFVIRGDVLRSRNEYAKALEALDLAMELRPELAVIHGTRGEVLRAMERNEEAEESLRRAVELNPQYAFAMAGLGELYRTIGKYQKARHNIEQALQIAGGRYAWASGILGLIEFDTGEFEAAVKAFQSAVELAPEAIPFAHAYKGYSLRLLKCFEEATSALETAVRRFPEFHAARVHLADALCIVGRREEATEMLREVVRELEAILDPDVQSLYLLGTSQALLKSYDEAMRTFMDGLAIAPSERSLRFDLALTVMRSKRYELGLEEYQRAVQETSKNDEPPRQRGLALIALRELETAVEINKLDREGPLKEAFGLLERAVDGATPDSAPT